MPLAIELAAARIKLLTPDQILVRLEHHLDLLTAGSRDLPERQQTLRGAIAWSYDLLDDGARRLVDRLSVFRGGFQLETAETRLRAGVGSRRRRHRPDRRARGPEPRPRRTTRPTSSGFSMLETIREYAAEMLDARGETTATQRPPRGRDDRAGRDRRRPSCRARTSAPGSTASSASTTTCARRSTGRPPSHEPEVAARLAYLLWRFWQQRGYLNEARARFDAMAAKDWDLEPVTRRAIRRGLRRDRLLAVRSGRPRSSGTTWRWRSGGRSATRARSRTPCSTGRTRT